MTSIRNKDGKYMWKCVKHNEIRWCNSGVVCVNCPVCYESMRLCGESPKKNPQKKQDQKLT